MTVSTTTSVVTYQGNGATTVFTFPFIADQPSDIQVTYTNALGISTVLSTTQYSLLINSPPVGGLWGIGGAVTYPNTGSPPVPIQVGTYLTINRIVLYTQDVSIGNQGAFYPQAVEQGLDVLELQIQQQETALAFTLRTPESDLVPPNLLPTAAARANSYLAFDVNGQPYTTTIPTVTPTPGAFANPRKISTTGTAAIPVTVGDSFGGVSIYQTGASATSILLPTTGGPYPIFDGGLNAGTYPIHIFPPSGKTIQGQSQYILSFNGQSALLYLDQTQVTVA